MIYYPELISPRYLDYRYFPKYAHCYLLKLKCALVTWQRKDDYVLC